MGLVKWSGLSGGLDGLVDLMAQRDSEWGYRYM